jgi:ubiquinone/menaquinone biosynthesis C-methylase UbiE
MVRGKGLQQAGVSPGMRILDVGSGAGDVAFLAASLVGATGEVIGMDKAQSAVERTNLEHRRFRYQKGHLIQTILLDSRLLPTQLDL